MDNIYRLILPKWAAQLNPHKPNILEGRFTDEQIKKYNADSYGIYGWPNYPSEYKPGTTVTGSIIDNFSWCFVDFDLKDGKYPSKDAFLEALGSLNIPATKIIDSGNGIHVYWQIDGLDAISYLRFQRRLVRALNTDEATCMLAQLMRVPGTINTKNQDNYIICEQIYISDQLHTAEELDKLLPPITLEDEAFCQSHYNKTYNINQGPAISDSLPPKFGEFLLNNSEAKELFAGESDDRSKSDYRLGHLMFANGFTRDEAASVLINSVKALERAPIHRQSYARNIVDKIWTYEEKKPVGLSNSVKDILSRSIDGPKGRRIPCWPYIDDTECGFRQGHVMGLVAGSGVGKTAMALNIFMGFAVSNPDLEHFFCPLEETDRDIAKRWQAMCGKKTHLYEKVHILSNYDENGTFRDLSLEDIQKHILAFQEMNGKKVGCVVIDHIGVLCNENKLGQDEGVKKIAKAMKGFAEQTQTFLIMQSQTSRVKAGIGDIELDKDAAFGTSVFENFCDYLVTLWQPFKRVYDVGAPTVMSYKFCKIRHKNQIKDVLKEDKPYLVFFDPETQLIRTLNQDESDSVTHWVSRATNKRKLDRRTEIIEYTSVKWETKVETRTNSN